MDNWQNFDAEAPTTEDATRRLAVCNMDWDKITADDLFGRFKGVQLEEICKDLIYTENTTDIYNEVYNYITLKPILLSQKPVRILFAAKCFSSTMFRIHLVNNYVSSTFA